MLKHKKSVSFLFVVSALSILIFHKQNMGTAGNRVGVYSW